MKHGLMLILTISLSGYINAANATAPSAGFSDQKVTHKCGLKITHLMVNKKDPNGSNCFSNISPKTLF